MKKLLECEAHCAVKASHPHIDLINFLVLKKWDVRDEGKNKANASGKNTHKTISKHQHRNQRKKVLFPEYKFHSLSLFHWSSNVLFAFFLVYFSSRKIFLHLFFGEDKMPSGDKRATFDKSWSRQSNSPLCARKHCKNSWRFSY